MQRKRKLQHECDSHHQYRLTAAYNLRRNNVRHKMKRIGVVPAALAGLFLILAACTQQIGQPTNSPEASPSEAASPTPSTVPTPAESPTPDASPTPAASPSPARLIITKVPFHMGEVGLAYATVVLGAAGGVKPYKWKISSGALPPGLALSSDGKITGKIGRAHV